MKKKIIFALSLMTVFTLAGCMAFDPVGNLSNNSSSGGTSSETSSGGGKSSSGGSSGGNSSSGNSSSGNSSSSSSSTSPDGNPIKSTKAFKIYTTLTNYSNSTYYEMYDYQDIPYVKFKTFYIDHYVHFQFGTSYDSYFTLTQTKISDHVFRFSNSIGSFQIDTEYNYMQVINPNQHYVATNTYDDTVSVLANGYETNFVQVNSKTKDLDTAKTVTFDLGHYNIKFIDYENEVYIPLVTFTSIFDTPNTVSFAFNGKDLYYTGNFSNNRYTPDISGGTLEAKYFNESPWLNKATRSESLANFTYNDLCFVMDNIYGLTPYRGVTNFDSFFQAQGYKADLLSTNTHTYECAMVRFVARWLYECHSGYLKVSPFRVGNSYQSYYNSFIGENEKYNKVVVAGNDLNSRRNSAGKGVGVTFSGNTAIITFDSFSKLPDTYGIDVDDYEYTDEQLINDNYLFFKKAFKDIESHGSISNVVVDVTLNGGGMVDALPWLYAFMSDDPFIVYKNTVTQEISEIHYNVDLDQDGYYGGAGDTYKDDYNFFIMTSNYSFSCGNAYPTFAKAGHMATIIGEESGGGACCVSSYVTASGTVLRFSSPFQFGGLVGTTWVANEDGVTPDHSFSRNNFYNDSAINTFVNSL